MLTFTKISAFLSSLTVSVLWYLLDIIYFFACLFEPASQPPELPVAEVTISTPVPEGVATFSPIVQEVNASPLFLSPPPTPKLSQHASDWKRKTQERLGRKKRHADGRVDPSPYNLRPSFDESSPSPEDDTGIEGGSDHSLRAPSLGRSFSDASDTSNISLDNSLLFSPSSSGYSTPNTSYDSCPSSPLPLPSPLATLMVTFSPGSSYASCPSTPSPLPPPLPSLVVSAPLTEAADPRQETTPVLDVHAGIGELGKRRGFKGTPLFTKSTAKKSDFLALPSPQEVRPPSRSGGPRPRSPLSVVTDFICSPTPTSSKFPAHLEAVPEVQNAIDEGDPFSTYGDSFYVSDVIPALDLNDFSIYNFKADEPCPTASASSGKQTSFTPSTPSTQMKTTIWDMSIYTYEEPKQKKRADRTKRRSSKARCMETPTAAADPPVTVDIVLTPPSPPPSPTPELERVDDVVEGGDSSLLGYEEYEALEPEAPIDDPAPTYAEDDDDDDASVYSTESDPFGREQDCYDYLSAIQEECEQEIANMGANMGRDLLGTRPHTGPQEGYCDMRLFAILEEEEEEDGEEEEGEEGQGEEADDMAYDSLTLGRQEGYCDMPLFFIQEEDEEEGEEADDMAYDSFVLGRQEGYCDMPLHFIQEEEEDEAEDMTYDSYRSGRQDGYCDMPLFFIQEEEEEDDSPLEFQDHFEDSETKEQYLATSDINESFTAECTPLDPSLLFSLDDDPFGSSPMQDSSFSRLVALESDDLLLPPLRANPVGPLLVPDQEPFSSVAISRLDESVMLDPFGPCSPSASTYQVSPTRSSPPLRRKKRCSDLRDASPQKPFHSAVMTSSEGDCIALEPLGPYPLSESPSQISPTRSSPTLRRKSRCSDLRDASPLKDVSPTRKRRSCPVLAASPTSIWSVPSLDSVSGSITTPSKYTPSPLRRKRGFVDLRGGSPARKNSVERAGADIFDKGVLDGELGETTIHERLERWFDSVEKSRAPPDPFAVDISQEQDDYYADSDRDVLDQPRVPKRNSGLRPLILPLRVVKRRTVSSTSSSIPPVPQPRMEEKRQAQDRCSRTSESTSLSEEGLRAVDEGSQLWSISEGH